AGRGHVAGPGDEDLAVALHMDRTCRIGTVHDIRYRDPAQPIDTEGGIDPTVLTEADDARVDVGAAFVAAAGNQDAPEPIERCRVHEVIRQSRPRAPLDDA